MIVRRAVNAGIAIAVVAAACVFALWVRRLATETPSSIVRIAHKDQPLQDAIAESRKQLPKFVERLKHPKPGDRFAIKAKFDTSVGPEYLWLKDPITKPFGFTATVDQQPIAAKIKRGEVVSVPERIG